MAPRRRASRERLQRLEHLDAQQAHVESRLRNHNEHEFIASCGAHMATVGVELEEPGLAESGRARRALCLAIKRRAERRERVAVHAGLQARIDDQAVGSAHHHAAGDAAVADERREERRERAAHAFPPSQRLARSSERSRSRRTYPSGTVRGAATSSTPLPLGAIATLAPSASKTIWCHAPSPRWRIARSASSLTPDSWAPMSAPRSRPSSVR